MSDMERTLKELLGRSGKSYLTLSAVKSALPAELRKQLGITAATTGARLRKILGPGVGRDLEIRRKGNVSYLVGKRDPAELVMKCLSSSSPSLAKGPAALGRSLPFLSKAELVSVLNGMIKDGRVFVALNEKYEARLTAGAGKSHVEPAASSASAPVPQPPTDRREAFHAAFDELDRGRIFVRICDLRRRLGWPREEFDATLRSLRDEELIQLHSGDATTMTPDEVRDSFVDENGFRMGTVTRNGK